MMYLMHPRRAPRAPPLPVEALVWGAIALTATLFALWAEVHHRRLNTLLISADNFVSHIEDRRGEPFCPPGSMYVWVGSDKCSTDFREVIANHGWGSDLDEIYDRVRAENAFVRLGWSLDMVHVESYETLDVAWAILDGRRMRTTYNPR